MTKLLINIIDYGVGNTHSIAHVLKYLGYSVRISDNHDEIKNADALILPGVGAFDVAVSNLRANGLEELLNELVLVEKKPILGICLGMQLMATYSEEYGYHKGLDWIKGCVVKLETSPEFLVPHVGWNNILPVQKEPLFSRADSETNFYFDHSYYFKTDEPKDIAAYVNYSFDITAAVQKDNICGVQFHPEKSQNNGLKLFRSYINSIEQYA
ncbi:imidazole glycerol phosphate synthase subunit HisH [Daejeonella sp.]|jgi:glutamine amidotransferase|uniref:imidazole glycerol phosphate synthase subunit HisH n=1 Tax=Daejeonella sp. TaxID=2805397 RepID=UPI0025BCF359|nr:imidazole glycerol phosphate synthase subunit HisH [Daejeonella sp.]